MASSSPRTVKFEFLVDADARQIDKFHDALKRVGDGSATSEKTLTSLREELQRFASITDKTENSLQAQISALRGASQNADLTGKEYGKLRAEIRALNAEYERLTALESDALKGQSTVLGSDNAFRQRIASLKEQAQAVNMTEAAYVQLRVELNALETEYKKLSGTEPNQALAEAQADILAQNRQYYQQLLEGERKLTAEKDAIRNEEFQATLADHKRLADAEIENFNRRLSATVNFRNAVKEGETVLQQVRLQQLESERSVSAQQDAIRNEEFQATLADHKRLADAEIENFNRRLSATVNFRNAVKEAQDVMQRIRLQELESQRSFAAQEDLIRNSQHDAEMADYKRRADASVADFDRRLENRVNSKKQRRSNIRELGNVASGIAIGGFFGGPEGLLGSTIGAGLGALAGPQGMVAGAQLGASAGLAVQQLRMQAAGVADMVAQLSLAKTTLAQVSTGQTDYNQKLQFARQVSTDYSVGLQTTIEGYAKVTAAATANGLTLKETETIYKGLLASGVAFGASQDDLKSIITATTQILSKGKISAEELSGQLGERIPGAVAKFAQATGRPLAQLAKDLQDGKVKIADFVKFARGQLDDYDAAAKLIGSSPEKAGERLNLALTRMAETYGGFFQNLGAGLQDSATQLVKWVNSQATNIKTLVGLFTWAAGQINGVLKTIGSIGNTVKEAFIPSGTFPSSGPGTRSTPTGPGTGFWADRLREGGRLFPEFQPTKFGGNQPAPVLGDLTGGSQGKAGAGGGKAQRETKVTVVIGGYTGGDQLGPSRGRSSGPHLHAQRVSGAGVNQMVAAALEFPGGRTALDPIYGERRRPGYHDGYRGNDYGTPQGTPFRLRPGWTGSDLGILGPLGRGMRVSGPGGVFELGHLAGIRTGKVSKSSLERNGGIDAQMAWEDTQADAEAKRKEDARRKAEDDAKGLSTARETLYTKQALLKIAEATNPMAKLEAEFEKEKADRMRDYAARLAAASTDQARQVEVASQILDIRLSERNYQQEVIDLTSQQLTQERERADLLAESMARMEELNSRSSAGAGFQQGIQGYVESVGNLRDAVGQLTTNSLGGLEDGLMELATTGTTNYRQFAASVLEDTGRMILRQLVLKTIMQIIGGIGGSSVGNSFEMPGFEFIPSGGVDFVKALNMPKLFASGGIMTQHGPLKLHTYSRGGVANTPQMAVFGEGSMPEAYVPLPDGKRIPVAMQGGGGAGGNVINISVDASGTKAQGDSGTSGALARDLASVVDARLVHHRRPGGLLS